MIEARDISKCYAEEESMALSDVSVAFGSHGLIAVCGPAACGKTALLNILGGLERADSGELLVDGKPASKFSEGNWNEYRNSHVGLVLQDPVFVKHRSVLENVELALTIEGVDRGERRDRALDALKVLGVESLASKKPTGLSGAHQRLVAIARALVKEPNILLADEPTCGLDKSSSETVMRAFERVAQSRLVIMATSDEELAARYAGRVIRLEGGKICGNEDAGESNAAEQAGEDIAQPSDEAGTESGASAKSRRSMPFLAAVSYSIRTISAKKGRAILTAIASAVSMIGIATIVALGVGANNLIAALEDASIATDPITIAKSALDLTGLLDSDSMKNLSAQGTTEENQSASSDGVRVNTLEGSVRNVSSMLSEMISRVRDNDLAGFKEYVDSNSSGILNNVDAVQYDYGVVPLVYNGDTSYGVERLNPSNLTTLLTRRAN